MSHHQHDNTPTQKIAWVKQFISILRSRTYEMIASKSKKRKKKNNEKKSPKPIGIWNENLRNIRPACPRIEWPRPCILLSHLAEFASNSTNMSQFKIKDNHKMHCTGNCCQLQLIHIDQKIIVANFVCVFIGGCGMSGVLWTRKTAHRQTTSGRKKQFIGLFGKWYQCHKSVWMYCPKSMGPIQNRPKYVCFWCKATSAECNHASHGNNFRTLADIKRMFCHRDWYRVCVCARHSTALVIFVFLSCDWLERKFEPNENSWKIPNFIIYTNRATSGYDRPTSTLYILWYWQKYCLLHYFALIQKQR